MKNKKIYYIFGGLLIVGLVIFTVSQDQGKNLQGSLRQVINKNLPSATKKPVVKPDVPIGMENIPEVDSNPNVELTPPDETKPTVTIYAPKSGQNIAGDKLLVNLQLEDNVGITKVEVYLDNKLVYNLAFESAPDKFIHTPIVDMKGLSDNNSVTLKAVAYDKAGNSDYSELNFQYQKESELEVSYPQIGVAIHPNAQKELYFKVDLDVFAISAVKFFVDDKLMAIDTDAPYSWETLVFKWGKHDGMESWYLHPKPYTPTELQCADADSPCYHTVKIEGSNGMGQKIVKELQVKTDAPWSLGENDGDFLSISVLDIKTVSVN